MQTALRHNPLFRRLSPLAKAAFCAAIMTVGDLEQDDKLTTRDGPLTEEELSYNLCVPAKQLKGVLDELTLRKFISFDGSCWKIEKFSEKTSSNAERQKRYRERNAARNAERNTDCNDSNGERDVTKVTIEKEIEKETDITANAVPAKPEPAPPKKSVKDHSPGDLMAWAILAEAVKVVWEYNRPGYSQADWKSRNKKAAVGLASEGHTPERIAELMATMYTHPRARETYGSSTKLMVVAENWSVLADLADDRDSRDLQQRIMQGEFLPNDAHGTL